MNIVSKKHTILFSFIVGLITFAPTRLYPDYPINTLEDICISFEMAPCGEQENKVFNSAFGYSGYFNEVNNTLISDGLSDETLDDRQLYKQSKMICVRAYGYFFSADGVLVKNLMGLVLFQRSYDQSNILCVEYLCTAQPYQGQGIGKALLAFLEERYQPDKIELCALRSAIGFYQKLGFTNTDNNTMVKTIKHS